MYTLGYTMYGNAGAVNPTIITNDPKQRPMMGFIGVAYSYLTPMIFNTMISFWILPKYDNQYNAEMLRDSCIIFVAFAAILTITTCIGIRKVDVEETYVINSETDKSQGRIKFKDMWHVLSKNRACQMYIISCATDKLAQSTATQAIIMTMLNGILIGSYKATTMINNFTMIVGIIFAFLGGLYVAKYGTKQATIVWSWVAIAVAVVTTGFCVVLGKDGMSQISVAMAPTVIYVVLMTATTAVRMILTTAAGAMRSDVVDYELERSGKYMPAVVGGVYSFIDKLMTALAAGLSAFCVAAIGYKDTMPQMGDKATTGVFLMTMVLSFGLPIVGWICNLVAMKYYPLSKERMVEVQRNIANMRKENQ
jgi:Na+/melibiose symporter-like transporter